MSFSITNNSEAVITEIAGSPNGNQTFTITSGTLPLFSGQTISGTNTPIINNEYIFFGANNGFISLLIEQGACQIDLFYNSNIYSSIDASSGWNTIRTPILSATDTFTIDLKNETAVVPSPTPTPSQTPPVTPTQTVTPSETPTSTPTPTQTETPTPTPTPSSTSPVLGQLWNNTSTNWNDETGLWNTI